MILSFHPFFHGHIFRLCAGRAPNAQDRRLMRQASAILLPPGRLPSLFVDAVNHCGQVFPNYAPRYAHPGKVGDIRLFRTLNLPHPRTHLFDRVADCPPGYWQGLEYPLVLKHNVGGEGRMVHLVHSPEQAREILNRFARMESSGMSGFLVQEQVITGQRTLRVVVMHRQVESYWRVQADSDQFAHNLAQGGSVDLESDSDLQEQGRGLVHRLCRLSGIDLAGVDVLFDHARSPQPRPLLLEVNYFFAVNGLGGLDAYHRKLKSAVGEWLSEHGLSLPKQDDP